VIERYEIVVVVPVLSRPDAAARVAESWALARGVPSRMLFVCSETDRDQIEACEDATWRVPHFVARDHPGAGIPDIEVAVLPGPWQPGDFARKVNYAFALTSEPFLFQAADDVEFRPGWDTEALMVADATGAGVVGTNDDANPTVRRGAHSTHSLIRRAYIDQVGGTWDDGPGVVFHEGYGHQWCDTELVEVAKKRGQWAFAPRAVVKHHHPFFDRYVPTDDTYRRGQSTGRDDQRLYHSRERMWT